MNINKDLIFTATSATPTAESIPVHYNDQVTRYPQPRLSESESGTCQNCGTPITFGTCSPQQCGVQVNG